MAITPAKKKGPTPAAKSARRVRTRHRQLMYRVLASEPAAKICAEMSISRETLDILIASPLFKSELAKLSEKLRERFLQSKNLTAEQGLRQLNPLALRTLTAIMNKEKLPLTIRRAVAKDIIDYNLKLDEIKKKGGLSENAAFFIKAHANAQKREARRKQELKELKELNDVQTKTKTKTKTETKVRVIEAGAGAEAEDEEVEQKLDVAS